MIGNSTRYPPAADKPHSFSLLVGANCTAGSGISSSFGGVSVIGTR